MGSVLLVGGWVELESESAMDSWTKKVLAASKLSGWDGPVAAPVPGVFDRLRVGGLWAKALEAPEPIEIVSSTRGVRFAAALASVTGRELWAPAFLAAVRRAAGAARGGAWAMLASEGPAVLAVSLTRPGAFRVLETDEEIAAVLAEPEMRRALELIDGNPPGEGALAALPPRSITPAESGAPTTRLAREGGGRATSAPVRRPVTAVRAKPAPRITKLGLRIKGSTTGAALLSATEVAITTTTGQLAMGDIEKNTWVVRQLDFGPIWGVHASGRRLWLDTSRGLRVTTDGTSFSARGPEGMRCSDMLFVEGAILVCSNGEILRSEDDGASWSCTYRVDDHYGVGNLARAAGDLILAVGLAGRVFVSHDLGLSFECVERGPSEAFTSLAIDGEDAWYLGPSRLLRASIKTPGTLAPAGLTKRRSADYARVRSGFGTVWLGGEYELLRTRDHGGSWELLVEKECVFSEMLPLGPRRAVVLASSGLAFVVDG